MNYLNMSAFNAQFVDNSSVEFVTLTEVTLPGPVPQGMRYTSELCTAVYRRFCRDASDDEINWYRQTISPDIDVDDREHNIKIFVNTLCVFKPSHHLFRWILKLTDILDEYVPKYSFSIRIGSKNYNLVYKHASGSTTNNIIRHTIDSMYDYNILTTFYLTTKHDHGFNMSYDFCPCRRKYTNYNGYVYDGPANGPDKCFWCYIRENGGLPYGIYLFDKTCKETHIPFYTPLRLYIIECVIYDINSEVVNWFINLERFHQLKYIDFIQFDRDRYYCSNNPRAYLTLGRLSLLIKLMKEDSHLLDKIYGTFSCKLVSETIIDVPPSDKSSIETQTEPPKGLLSRIFGL